MLRRVYETANQSALGPDDLETVLFACIKLYDKVYVLADAVDECPCEREVRDNVLRLVERLARNALNLQVSISSREAESIREAMGAITCEPLSITASAVNSDIRKYVSAQLSEDRKFHRFGEPMRDLIELTIESKADGM